MPERAETETSLLVCTAGGETFAIDLARVRRAGSGGSGGPGSPDLIRIGGEVLERIDLAERFGSGRVTRGRAVVVHGSGRDAALLVHRVEGVRRVPGASIEASGGGGFVAGVCSDGETLLIVLDIDRLIGAALEPAA